jgi:hypothetical protein
MYVPTEIDELKMTPSHWELRLREGLRMSKIATSNEYKKGTQAGDLLSTSGKGRFKA